MSFLDTNQSPLSNHQGSLLPDQQGSPLSKDQDKDPSVVVLKVNAPEIINATDSKDPVNSRTLPLVNAPLLKAKKIEKKHNHSFIKKIAAVACAILLGTMGVREGSSFANHTSCLSYNPATSYTETGLFYASSSCHPWHPNLISPHLVLEETKKMFLAYLNAAATPNEWDAIELSRFEGDREVCLKVIEKYPFEIENLVEIIQKHFGDNLQYDKDLLLALIEKIPESSEVNDNLYGVMHSLLKNWGNSAKITLMMSRKNIKYLELFNQNIQKDVNDLIDYANSQKPIGRDISKEELLQHDYNFMRQMVYEYPETIHLAGKFLSDHVFVYDAIVGSEKIQKDRAFILHATSLDSDFLKLAHTELLKDPIFMADAADQNSELIKYADKVLLNDPIFMKNMLSKYFQTLQFIGPELRSDKLFVADIRNIILSNEKIRKDRNSMALAASIDSELIKHFDDELLNDYELMRNIIGKYPDTIHFLGSTLRSDKLFFSRILSLFTDIKYTIEFIGKKNVNKDNILPLIERAITNSEMELLSALVKELDLLDNKNIALAMIKKNIDNLKIFNKSLMDDKDFALNAVQKCQGMHLETLVNTYFSSKLENDLDIFLKVVERSVPMTHSLLGYIQSKSNLWKNDHQLALELCKSHIPYFFPDISENLRNNKTLAIQLVPLDGNAIKSLGYNLQNDEDILSVIIESVPNDYLIPILFKSTDPHMWNLNSLGNTIRNNSALMFNIVSRNIEAMEFIGEKLRADPIFIAKAISINPQAFKFMNKELKNKELMAKVVSQNKEFWNNSSSMQEIISVDSETINYINLELLKDNELLEKFFSQTSQAFGKLRRDPIFIARVLSINTQAIKFMDKELKNKELMKNVVSQNKAFWNNPSIILEIISLNSEAMHYIDLGLSKSAKFMAMAVLENCSNIQYMDPSLLDDEEFTARFLSQTDVVKCASKKQKNDVTFMTKAIKANNNNREYIGEDLRNDWFKILTLLENGCDVMDHASEAALEDDNLMRNAIILNSSNLQYLTNKQRNNDINMLVIIKTSAEAMRFASKKLQMNPNFIRHALSTNEQSAIYIDDEHLKNPEIRYELLKLKSAADIFLKRIEKATSFPEYLKDLFKTEKGLNLLNDEGVFLALIEKFGTERELFDRKTIKEKWINNKKLALKLCQQNALLCAEVSPELKKDPAFLGIFLNLIQESLVFPNYLFKYKDDFNLLNDKAIFLALIEKFEVSKHFFEQKIVKEKWVNNKEFALKLCQKNDMFYADVSSELKKDPDFVLNLIKEATSFPEYLFQSKAGLSMLDDTKIFAASIENFIKYGNDEHLQNQTILNKFLRSPKIKDITLSLIKKVGSIPIHLFFEVLEHNVITKLEPFKEISEKICFPMEHHEPSLKYEQAKSSLKLLDDEEVFSALTDKFGHQRCFFEKPQVQEKWINNKKFALKLCQKDDAYYTKVNDKLKSDPDFISWFNSLNPMTVANLNKMMVYKRNGGISKIEC